MLVFLCLVYFTKCNNLIILPMLSQVTVIHYFYGWIIQFTNILCFNPFTNCRVLGIFYFSTYMSRKIINMEVKCFKETVCVSHGWIYSSGIAERRGKYDFHYLKILHNYPWTSHQFSSYSHQYSDSVHIQTVSSHIVSTKS